MYPTLQSPAGQNSLRLGGTGLHSVIVPARKKLKRQDKYPSHYPKSSIGHSHCNSLPLHATPLMQTSSITPMSAPAHLVMYSISKMIMNPALQDPLPPPVVVPNCITPCQPLHLPDTSNFASSDRGAASLSSPPAVPHTFTDHIGLSKLTSQGTLFSSG